MALDSGRARAYRAGGGVMPPGSGRDAALRACIKAEQAAMHFSRDAGPYA